MVRNGRDSRIRRDVRVEPTLLKNVRSNCLMGRKLWAGRGLQLASRALPSAPLASYSALSTANVVSAWTHVAAASMPKPCALSVTSDAFVEYRAALAGRRRCTWDGDGLSPGNAAAIRESR